MTPHPELTEEQQRVKEEFVAVRGTWGEPWQRILELDPGVPAGLPALLRRAVDPASHLEPKVKEFVYIAADAAATHLYVPGIRQHVAAALEHGATPEEIMEVWS